MALDGFILHVPSETFAWLCRTCAVLADQISFPAAHARQPDHFDTACICYCRDT